MILKLPDSKGAARSGLVESVEFKDPAFITQRKSRWERWKVAKLQYVQESTEVSLTNIRVLQDSWGSGASLLRRMASVEAVQRVSISLRQWRSRA